MISADDQTRDILPAQRMALDFQLKLLDNEIKSIDEIMARFDNMCQTTKNWSVLSWTGGLAVCLQFDNLRSIVGMTALFPILFWYLDAQFRSLQRRSGYRMVMINEWVNSPHLVNSFSAGSLINFNVVDPVGRLNSEDKDYKEYSSILRTMRFPEISIFYLSMIIASVIVQMISLIVF